MKTLQEEFAEEYRVYTLIPDLLKDRAELVKDLTEAQRLLKDLYRAFYIDSNYPVEFDTNTQYSKIVESGTFIVGVNLLQLVDQHNKNKGYKGDYPSMQSFIHRCVLAVGDKIADIKHEYALNLENSSFFKVTPLNTASYNYLKEAKSYEE